MAPTQPMRGFASLVVVKVWFIAHGHWMSGSGAIPTGIEPENEVHGILTAV